MLRGLQKEAEEAVNTQAKDTTELSLRRVGGATKEEDGFEGLLSLRGVARGVVATAVHQSDHATKEEDGFEGLLSLRGVARGVVATATTRGRSAGNTAVSNLEGEW